MAWGRVYATSPRRQTACCLGSAGGFVHDGDGDLFHRLGDGFDASAGKEVRNHAGQHRTDLGVAVASVNDDRAWEHERGAYIFLQHLVRVLCIADLDNLERLARKAFFGKGSGDVVDVQYAEAFCRGDLFDGANRFIERLGGANGVLNAVHRITSEFRRFELCCWTILIIRARRRSDGVLSHRAWAAGQRIDFILDAVSADHDINAFIHLLRRHGNLTLVGAPEKPLAVSSFGLIMGRRSLSGSPIGGIAETQEMLDFCGQHNITADVEVILIQKVNEAYERLVRADVKYRFSIDMASLRAE